MENSVLMKKFNFFSIFKYALPTVIMMVFMSTYTIIDGMFVSNYVNENALSAINIVYPVMSIGFAIALMFATGANAIIARLIGEGDATRARSFFTSIYLIGIMIGAFFTLIILIFPEQILLILGTSDALYEYAKIYLLGLGGFFIPLFLQVFTQCFFVTAGKPIIGFVSSFSGGLANIFLDYLLIKELEMGILGAILATGASFTIPGIFGLIYFAINKKSILHFVKPVWNKKDIVYSMYNGLSECVTNLSTAITTFMFNIILLNIAGESGVASISVILYIQMIQIAVYMGYSMGVSPIISCKYGMGDHEQLKKITKISFIIMTICSVAVILFSVVFADFAIGIFISPNSPTFNTAKTGLIIFSTAYIFMGINMYISSHFTALSNGKVSAILSVLRTLVFIVISLLTLPNIFGIIGVWLAVPVAEFLTVAVSIYMYKRYKKEYGY